MPFGIRPFLVAERQHIEFQRNISSAKHISSFALAKHIENPKDLYKNSSSEAVCDTSAAIYNAKLLIHKFACKFIP